MKKICKIIAITTLVFMLTGCMKIRANIVIENESTASAVTDILYSKKMLDSYKMDLDDLKEQFSNEDNSGGETKDIKETIDGEDYLGLSVTSSKKEINELLDGLSTRDADGKKEYTLALTKEVLGEKMDPGSMGGAQYSLKQMKDAGLEMTMTVQMPGKITEATVGNIKGNTITIDLLDIIDSNGTIATVTSLEGGTSNAIYLYSAIGVGIVAILAIVYTIISRKKKKNTDSNVITIDEQVEITSESIAPKEALLEPIAEQTLPTDIVNENTINEADTTKGELDN